MKVNFLWMLILPFVMLGGCTAKTSPALQTDPLTLAVFMHEAQLPSSALFKWVQAYNAKNPDVEIEIVNYYDYYQDPWEAMDKLKIEIIAGKGPDMINFASGWNYSPLDASSGMFTDLYPFMQNDESFDEDDFYYNVLGSFAVGDGLYVLVPSFIIKSFATVNSDLSALESMDVWQMVDAYDMLDDESILFPGETKKDVLAKICHGGMENYVDWGAGTCHFDSDSFKEVLLFANRFPLTLNIPDDYSAKAFFTEGRALLYPVHMDNVYVTAATRTLYGKTPTYIGFPFDAGNGNLAQMANIAIGISGVSKNKEEAWGFLASLLGSEFQDSVERGLPIRVSSLEQMLADALSAEYDASGEMVVKDRMLWYGEDPVNIYEISPEDAETLEAIIRKIEFNTSLDYALYTIMLEEADYLFNDGRDVEAVADIIQNRASLYVSEQK